MTIALRTATASLVTLLAIATAWAQSLAPVADIMRALRTGGHVIVVRHGATHADQADTDPLNPDNVAKQRHLNERGREQARGVGEALKAAHVPIGKSYSSRFQRAVETARLIGGKEPQAILDVTEGGLVVTPAENNRRAQALRALAATVPDPGTNTLIVTHKPNIMDAFGKDWFEVREGEASIFRPDGSGKYTLVGRVRIDEWESATR
jgi:broad specificity phosphatase PhoE